VNRPAGSRLPAALPGLWLVVAALAIASPFVDLGRRVLWPPDEGRYAVVIREMAASGDWVVPTYGGKPRIDKPPLFLWAGAAASRLAGGVSEATVRLPSAVAAAAALVATAALGARLFDPATGLLAALVLATCGRFLLYSQWAATDMTLAALTTIALAAAAAGGAVPAGPGRRPRLLAAGPLFFGAAALAVLAKGPVGVVLPAAVVLADHAAAARGRPRALLEAARRLAPAWAAGAAVFAAVAAPWFILLHERLGAGALREVLFRQNVGRFLDAWNAQQPWHFYFKVLPMDLMPWTLFLPAAFLPLERIDEGRPGAWRFPRVWLVLVFAFFSAASGKSPEYLMPLLPAAAILIARVFVLAGPPGSAGAGPRPGRSPAIARWWIAGAGGALAAAGAAGALLLPGVAGARLPGSTEAAAAAALAAALVAAGAAAAVALARRGRAAAGAVALAAAVLAVRFAAAGPLVDAGNALQAAPEAGRALAEILPPDAEVGVGRKGGDYIMYYAARPVVPLERPGPSLRFLQERPGRALVLKAREHRELAPRLGPGIEVVGRWGDEERGFVLLRNTGAAAPAGAGGR
jgi:4-amino-4-deoxy-L-arabinose transferase-like glycosyltransferase